MSNIYLKINYQIEGVAEIASPLGSAVFQVTWDGHDTQMMMAQLSHTVYQAQWVSHTLIPLRISIANIALIIMFPFLVQHPLVLSI